MIKPWKKQLEEICLNHKTIWIHVSGIAEAQTGEPLIRALKEKYPSVHLIVLVKRYPALLYVLKNFGNSLDVFLVSRRSVALKNIAKKTQTVAFFSIENSRIWWFFKEFRARKIPVVFLSAKRPRKFRHFSFLKPLGKFLYRNVSHVFAASEQHFNLFQSIGVDWVQQGQDLKFTRQGRF